MRQGRSVVSVAELAIFLWALYIGTVFALLLDRWFEALRRGQGPGACARTGLELVEGLG